MTGPRVLAIDQGTTNTKALLVDPSGRVLARASAPLTTTYPRPGWVEQSADAIWQSVRTVIAEIVAEAGPGGVDAIAVANQRETLVVWDAVTGASLCPAIVWQCRRTADACAALIAAGHDAKVVATTGLGINPLFPASKLSWVVRNVPSAAEALAAGRLRAGTVDAWLLWNLSGGTAFATDHSNASRTQLFDTGTLRWSTELAAVFDAPVHCLPETMPSDSEFGRTAAGATALPAGVPVRAMMGDSHAALFGHGVRTPGAVKATFGTGSSLMTLTPGRTASANGLSGTIAWSDSGGAAHALEGNITVSAQAAAFMARTLGLPDAAALSSLAETVPDAGGVVFVPALAGLGAPYWDDGATGLLTGMTHATLPAHLAHATIEAIAHQIADVFEAMERDVGHTIHTLRADGGASSNGFLMQMQADLLGRPVQRATIEEVGAIGVAAMAFASMGIVREQGRDTATVFLPRMQDRERLQRRQDWADAVSRARR